MTLNEIVAWLKDEYPRRDWNQDCQRLVWNVVWHVTGVDESELNPPYPTATAARLASSIESLDASKAPEGAIHYFKNPADGHVGVSLGGESILMTGTKKALGKGATHYDGNFGVTTVSAYVAAMRNPYLGWSRQNGRFPTLIGKIGAKPKPATPKPVNRSNKMIGLYGADGEGRYGKKGVTYWWVFDPDNRVITYLDAAGAKALSTTMGTSFGNTPYKTWDAFHMQADTFIDATVDPPVRLSGPKGKHGTEATA